MRERKVETVLLDEGGVLLDLDYAFLQSLLRTRGVEAAVPSLSEAESIARTEIDRRVRSGGRTSDAWRDYFRILLARVATPPSEVEGTIDGLWEAHQRSGLWTRAIDGARETLEALARSGYRLGVVSNAEGRVARDLDGAGYASLFETVVDSHLVGVQKPDPAIFRIALDRMGASADRTVFVGDVPAVDVAGARAAGLAPILLDRHDLYRDVDVPRLRSIRELPALLHGA